MIYTIWDGKTIEGFQKFLDNKRIKYSIDWGACAIATFNIQVEDYQRWEVQQGYKRVCYELYH